VVDAAPVYDECLTEGNTAGLNALEGRRFLIDLTDEVSHLGRIQAPQAPNVAGGAWRFPVVFDGKVTDIFEISVIKGPVLPRGSGATNTLEFKGQLNRIKNRYKKVQEYMAAGPLPTNVRTPEVLTAITMVLAIKNLQVVIKSDLPTKLKELQRLIHPDKTSGLTANRRHFAKLVLAVADYVTKLVCHARDPNSRRPTTLPTRWTSPRMISPRLQWPRASPSSR
jgi:hypothetical protein